MSSTPVRWRLERKSFTSMPTTRMAAASGDAWYYGVDNVTAPVMSLSYGLCEEGEADNVADGATGEFTFTSDEAELAEANSEGITFMNSSGDAGTATCDGDGNTGTAIDGYAVSYPASSVYVTAVGGTLVPGGVPNEYNDTYWGTSNGTTGGEHSLMSRSSPGMMIRNLASNASVAC